MQKLKISYVLIPFFLLASSCADIKPLKKKSRYTKYQTDPDVEKSFEDLEKDKILDYYYRLRMREHQKSHRRDGRVDSKYEFSEQDYESQRRLKKLNSIKRRQYKKPRVTSVRPYSKSKSKGRKILVDPKENEIRVNQLISFHCMRFRKEDNCQGHTQSVTAPCKQKYEIDDQRLVSCIEKGLSRL